MVPHFKFTLYKDGRLEHLNDERGWNVENSNCFPSTISSFYIQYFSTLPILYVSLLLSMSMLTENKAKLPRSVLGTIRKSFVHSISSTKLMVAETAEAVSHFVISVLLCSALLQHSIMLCIECMCVGERVFPEQFQHIKLLYIFWFISFLQQFLRHKALQLSCFNIINEEYTKQMETNVCFRCFEWRDVFHCSFRTYSHIPI